jgi:hypothetical protein
MKAIFTIVALLLIVATLTSSSALFLRESYNLSAALSIVWIGSLIFLVRSVDNLIGEKQSVGNA